MLRILALISALFLAPLAQAAEPAMVVDSFHATLIDNMKGGKALGCSGRNKKMATAVDNAYDLPYLAQKLLRKRWGEMNDAQKKQFTEALRDMVVSTYAAQFSSYSGESFSIAGTEPAGANKVVHAKLKTSGSTINFDYVMRDTGGGVWRVANVFADGVSDLATRAPQYESLYKQKGLDGLIGYIKDQTAKNKAGC